MDELQKFYIKHVLVLDDFVLEICFADGKIQVIDFGKFHFKGFWEKLNNLEYFNKFKINEIDNLEWPSHEDFNPEHLYYWEEYEKFYLKKYPAEK